MRRCSLFAWLLLVLATAGAQAQTPSISSTGSITTNGATVTYITGNIGSVPVPGGYGTAAVEVTGTFTGTLTFEGSVSCSTYVTPSTWSPTSTTTTGLWQFPVAGFQCIRVRATAFASGTAVITIRGAGGGGASGGSSSSVTVNDPSVTSQKAAVNASGQLSVNCANCTGSGVSQQDNTAFTAGTSNIVPMGAMFDDVASATATENAAAVLRMTTNKGLHVNLRNVAGTEIGTASTPIQVSLANTAANATAVKVDNSAVTQPVSGSVTVTQATGTNLHTVCDSGCSGSAGFADNAAFTFGTTAINPIGGVFDDVASNTATENSAAVARITANKAIHVNFRNASGTEIGTSSNPIQVTLANTGANATAVKVDNSAVTQPVSGTVTATGGVTPADTFANPTTAQSTWSLNGCWNGTTWDRCKASSTGAGATDATTQRTVTASDSPDVAALGATADAASSGAVSINAHLRFIAATGIPVTALPANASVNVAQINGVTTTMGNGVSGTGVQRVTLASDSTGQVTLAAGTALAGSVVPVATATTTNTTLPCYLTSAATTNATNCKASGGNLYHIQAINTTATLYYLRLYNLAAAPTCSSATGFVRTIPIPASATGAGVVIPQDLGEGYATGLGFCLTGGGSSTDNTSAATGVYLTLLYK